MPKIKIRVKEVKTGDRFGRLTVVSKSIEHKSNNISNCICDCGNIFTLPTTRLIDVRSCGCFQKEKHNESKTPLHNIWCNMKGRCYTITNKQYADYGGRGIVMCERMRDYLGFKETMGDRPSKNHSVDRINNDGNYCCGFCKECIINGWVKNVRWATAREQSYNKRTNLYLSYKGEKLCLSELCRKYNLNQPLIHQRITILGWDLETAINTPVNRVNRYLKRGNIGKNQYSK